MICFILLATMICFILLAFIIILYIISISKNNSKYLKMPPCLKKIPVLGNIQVLLKQRIALPIQFMNMSKDLGPVFTFWLGDKPVVIINDFEIAKNVLSSKDFAGRPQRYTSSVYSRQFKGIITTDYNNEFLSRVSIVNESMRFFSKSGMEDILTKESICFVNSINEKIVKKGSILNLSEDINLLATNTIWRLLFNKRFEHGDSDYNSLSKMIELITEGIAVANLIDGFPLLRNIPFSSYLYFDDFNVIRDHLISKYVEKHCTTRSQNDINTFTDRLLTEDVQLTRDNIEIILTDVLCAGIETVSFTFRFVVLYLILNKSIADKCVDEIEHVIGKNKPCLADIGNLHYIRAVISEVMRISPVAPFGVPHSTTQDAALMEYNIPKNTTLLINIFAVHHNNALHLKPNQFEPERFLDQNGKYRNIDGFFPFSKGRRQCIGKQFAIQELIFYLVSLLQNFNIETPNNFDLTNGTASYSNLKPKEHEVKISCRKMQTCMK